MKTESHCGPRKPLVIVAALAVALALSAQAQAQNASDQAAAPPDQSAAADTGTLQEVVVTAERRAVDIQQTPIIVTAIQGDQLQSQHIATIEDLPSLAPGLQTLSQNGQFIDNNIRGLGTAQNTPSLQLGTKVIIDGVVQDIVSGLDQGLYDIADVEVLEGPQGTFVGASAIGGAIEQNTNNPNFNGVNGYLLVGGGSYQDVKVQGAVNMPISDTLALRAAFNFEQRHSFSYNIGDSLNGFYYNTYSATNPASDGPPIPLLAGPIGAPSLVDPGNLDTHQVRLKMLWKPTDNFQSLTSFTYSQNQSDGVATEPATGTYQTLWGGTSTTTGCTATNAATNFPGAVGTQLVCPNPGVVTHSQYYYPGEKPFVLDYYGTNQEYNDFYWMLGQEFKYTLPDDIVLRSQSGFIHINQQQISDPSNGPQNAGVSYHPNGPNYIPSEELDVISPSTGKLTWIGGAYYELRYAPIPNTTFSVPAPYQPLAQPTTLAVQAIADIIDRVSAVFGQVNYQLTDSLQLQVGARMNWDDDTSSNPYTLAPAVGTTAASPNGTGTYSILYTAAACGTILPPCYKVISQSQPTGHFTDSIPTGKINLEWTPLPGQNFYLFYARGYSAGAPNQGSLDHPVFNPEYANDWEAGWKGRLLNGHMLTQLGVYYENLQGYQFPVLDTQAVNDTTTGSYIANLGPSTIEGVSFAAQSRFGGFGFDISANYNKATLGGVNTVNNGAFPAGFGSGLALPQCLPGHTYPSPQQCFDYRPYLAPISGEQMPWAPKYQGNAAMQYVFHVGNGTVTPRVTYSYTASQYGSLFENSYTLMGSRSLVGATIDWVVGKWDTQLWGTNLNNQLYIYDNTGAGVVSYGAPRQGGVQLTYKF